MDALEYLIVTYINYHQFLFYMYAVIVFALALLSPLPFVSPFDILFKMLLLKIPRQVHHRLKLYRILSHHHLEI